MKIPPHLVRNHQDVRWRSLEKTIKRYQYRQDTLIEVLHKAQEFFCYLEKDVLLYIAHQLKLPPSRVYGVATFYHLFSLNRSGIHSCVVCTGTACYVKGAMEILAQAEEYMGISAGATTADGQVSLMTSRCLGTCGSAPVVIMDNQVIGSQTPESVRDAMEAWFKDGII